MNSPRIQKSLAQAAIQTSQNLIASRKLLTEIEASVRRLEAVQGKTWADAGTASYLREQLQNIADSIANCAR
jgi:hypothetical protein